MTGVVELIVAQQSVSRETFDTLKAFEAEVRRWTSVINLVSKASVPTLWERHIVDSAQLFPLCPPNAEHWADFGSGGGFPGLVIAILAKESKPNLRVTLVESDVRKATFLREVARTLSLNVHVVSERIESLKPLDADVVSARALAPLSDLLAAAHQHLRASGTALFPKGARHQEEIAEARQHWAFAVECHRSVSDSDAAILLIKDLDRAGH